MVNLPVFQRALHKPLQWCVIALGCFVTVSVALDNLAMALILMMCALLGFKGVARVVVAHPVARAALLLWGVLLVAMFYGGTAIGEAFTILMKYVDFAFIAIFILVLSDETARRRARYAFLWAMIVTLVLSYLLALKILPVMPAWMNPMSDPHTPVIFYDYITQNSMMAIAVFLALLESREALTRAKKIAWLTFALFGIANILFMVQGRTGYLVLFVLLSWFAWTSVARMMFKLGKRWGWQQKILVVATIAASAAIVFHSSTLLHDRVALAVTEYRAWTPNHGKDTSTGQRLDFYFNSLQIVRDHALFGVGTGGFPDAYALQTQGLDVMETRNPHNEYLMISVQTGLVGLGLLLYLFYTQWRYAPRLPTAYEQDAARGILLAYMASCMINSPLMDHAEGLLFSYLTAVFFSNLKLKHG